MLSRSVITATIPTRGVKKVGDFYLKKLRLPLRDGGPKEGWMVLGGGKGTTLLLFESDEPNKSGNTAATFHVKDLDKEMKALRAKGVKFEEYDLPSVKTVDGVAEMGPESTSRMAWLKDPAGNLLALYEE